MSGIINKLNRELASARSIPLYKDQELRIKKLGELMGRNNIKVPATTELVRLGMDLILDKLESELKDN